MQISYLADHPEFIATLAPWVYAHWRPILSQDTLEDRVAKLRAHFNRDSLPIAWVAHAGSQVFGTAALREQDLPGREDLGPWLGGVFVASAHRGQGIGAELCEMVEHYAKNHFKISRLYLFTLDKQTWYTRLGWRLLGPCVWCGQAGNIMDKKL